MKFSTIRPGLLVSLKTGLSGNVTYRTQDIEPDHATATGERQARWETERTIADPVEHEDAVKVRGKARSLISTVCSPSSFGLLCPEASADALTAAIAEARVLIEKFNARATVTQIAIYVIAGRVASDDLEAIRAINGEMRELITSMMDGLEKLDVKAVREAADKARSLAAMLSPDAARRAHEAIETARRAAKQIVKAGDTLAITIDKATIDSIRTARTAFLDLGPAEDVQTPESVGRAVDFGEVVVPMASAAPATRAAIEI